MKLLICVLGMHRSGTSFFTSAMSQLGLTLPRSIQKGAFDNPDGHFEPMTMVEIHDQIFDENNMSWYSLEMVQENWFSSDSARKYKDRLVQEFYNNYNDSPLVVLKDPRISKLVPLWVDVADSLGYEIKFVVCTRNPIEVAGSLKARDGFDEGYGVLLWAVYTACATFYTNELPRVFVNFPSWLKDMGKEFNKIDKTLNVSFSPNDPAVLENIKRSFKPEHVHNNDEENTCKEVFPWAYDFYQLFHQPNFNPSSEEFCRCVEMVFETYKKAVKEFVTEFGGSVSHAGSLQVESNFIINKIVEFYSVKLALQKSQEKLNKHIDIQKSNEEKLRIQKATIKELSQENKDLIKTNELLGNNLLAANDLIRQNVNDLQALKCEVDVIKPIENMESKNMLNVIYRKLYPLGGKILRMVVSDRFVDNLAQKLPLPKEKDKGISYDPRYYSISSAELSNLCLQDSFAKKDLYVFSIIGWHFRTQRPQHIARELVNNGYRVFYVEMDLDDFTSCEMIETDLYRVRFGRDKLGHIQPYTGVADQDVKERWIDNFLEFVRQTGNTGLKQVVIQHPFWWQFAKLLSPEFRLVFDCMDDIGGFDNTTDFQLQQEKEMLLECDQLVVSSNYLQKKYGENKPSTLIRNAGQIEHFNLDTQDYVVPDFIEKIKAENQDVKIHIGYVGAIAHWFDWELLYEVANNRKDVFFHIAGAVTEEKVLRLDELPNVHLYGEIDYDSVPGFIRAVDMGMIPFKIIPIIKACDPVKFYEYCGVGVPTIVTPMPELERASELTFIAQNAEEFSNQIDNAFTICRNKNNIKMLKEFAFDNTWKQRGKLFSKTLSENIPLVSVVVLSYGDPEITLACLDSLLKSGGTYPNMEVLVVDNGSSDENLAKIEYFIKESELSSSIKLIKNGENLGFAAGNNVGLEASSGDYILLLNNDTYVAPGAIYAMVRHLENNEQLGIIGPLTNNIGNEARIEVAYSDMSEMEEITRKLTSGYRGKNTPMNVAAYFAVMFRKADLLTVGLLSLDYGLGMFEDDDHCNMFKEKGFSVALAEDAFIHHHLSASFDKMGEAKVKLFNKNKDIYESKWGEWIPHRYRDNRPKSEVKK